MIKTNQKSNYNSINDFAILLQNTLRNLIAPINVKKDPLLKEYLSILKNPKHGTGAGINPCKDCKIFMFKKAKEYADKNNIQVIATGEVIGQRPMSHCRPGRGARSAHRRGL